MKNLKKYIMILAVILSVFMVSACNRNIIPDASNVVGLMFCNQLGGYGAVACARVVPWTFNFASTKVFDYLDEREKQQAIDAANDSLAYPNENTVKWRSKTNNNVSGFATASAFSGECRDVKHTIVKDGKQYNNTVKLCKDPGSGRMVRV